MTVDIEPSVFEIEDKVPVDPEFFEWLDCHPELDDLAELDPAQAPNSEVEEIIVNKVGGTSNATAHALRKSMSWAEDSLVTVVSAPGKLKDNEYGQVVGVFGNSNLPKRLLQNKVTDVLLEAYSRYHDTEQRIQSVYSRVLELRYRAIAEPNGIEMPEGWYESIRTRMEAAALEGKSNMSILGERLMAEVWEAAGFELLDPGIGRRYLGDDHEAWRSEFHHLRDSDRTVRYVVPGNTTTMWDESRREVVVTDFARGGSDISGGLMAYAFEADLHRNLTDSCALTADPRLVEGAQPIQHMLYIIGRELGLSGTGLVHPTAMVPLMIGDTPTHVRSTFESDGPVTVLDNNWEFAEDNHRAGYPEAVSLMRNVVVLTVHEPGMEEQVGRVNAITSAVQSESVNLVDIVSDGFDRQSIVVEADDVESARRALEGVVMPWGNLEVFDPVSLITVVGRNLRERILDHSATLWFNTRHHDGRQWQERHSLRPFTHSMRFEVSPEHDEEMYEILHFRLIGGPALERALQERLEA